MAQERLQKSVQGIKDPAARKKAYYSLQRQDAAEGGNQALSDRINKKLGKQSSSVDTESVNKGLLGTLPFLAAPEARLAGAAGRAIGGAAKKYAPKALEAAEGAASNVIRGAEDLAGRAGNAIRGAMSKGSRTARVSGQAGGRSGGKVVRDFGNQAQRGSSSKFTPEGARRTPKATPEETKRVMGSMRKPGNAPKKEFKSIPEAKDGRKAKDVVKDFGKQARDNRPAAPSRPREARGEFGGDRNIRKRVNASETVGRKKKAS